MEIKEEIQINLTPDDIQKLIREHFKEQYNIETINFDVNGYNDPDDWQGARPLSYRLDNIRCVGTKIK